jgi:hypothetical protein
LTVAAFAVTEVADPTERLGVAPREEDKIKQKLIAVGRAIPTLKMKMPANHEVKAFS